jgi:hypothetical protein
MVEDEEDDDEASYSEYHRGVMKGTRHRLHSDFARPDADNLANWAS